MNYLSFILKSLFDFSLDNFYDLSSCSMILSSVMSNLLMSLLKGLLSLALYFFIYSLSIRLFLIVSISQLKLTIHVYILSTFPQKPEAH